jgi:molecular chaperone Hsp33
MPGVEESLVEKIQENADHYKPNVSQEIFKGKSEQELVIPYLTGIPFQEIPHEFETQYFCPCTQERVLRSLGTLGLEDLEDMINQKENAEITCQMCGRRYTVTVEELKELKTQLHRSSLH